MEVHETLSEPVGELVELEVGELLEQYGFTDVPIVRGSALQALEASRAGSWDAEAVGAIAHLVDTMDVAIPNPQRDREGAFLMPIEDVVTKTGRGTVVTGRVERGVVRVGDTVEVVGLHRDGADGRTIVVTGTEVFRRKVDAAEAGMNVGLLLRGVRRDEIERGQVLATPGTVHSHRVAKAELTAPSRRRPSGALASLGRRPSAPAFGSWP